MTVIDSNEIFRNDCGGIRISLNRFEDTIVMRNSIHDHTGPDIVQTVFPSEFEAELRDKMKILNGMKIPTLSREKNMEAAKMMGNVSYNNELCLGTTDDIIVGLERNCSFCNRPGAAMVCPKCSKVIYCDFRCKDRDKIHHSAYCKYLRETHTEDLDLDTSEGTWVPNKLIEDRTDRTKRLKDYKGKEFLVKITAGGGPRKYSSGGNSGLGLEQGDDPNDDDRILVYDEARFICGRATNPKIYDLTRNFGKLCMDKLYSKRIYLKARLIGKTRNRIRLVDINKFYHDQPW